MRPVRVRIEHFKCMEPALLDDLEPEDRDCIDPLRQRLTV